MNLNIISTMDDGTTTVVETVEDNVYEYVKNIVDKYHEEPLKIVMRITGDDWFVEVELYDNTRSVQA